MWTLTVWRDRAALAAFARSPLHREAIARAGDAILSLETADADISAAEVPVTWEAALAVLRRGGS